MMKLFDYTPKLFSLIQKKLVFKNVGKDILSGIIVGIIALPMAIAFAIASGVSPEKGLITAIVAGFFIAAFGGSRVSISGPTGAFVVIILSVITRYTVSGLIIATFMAGVILIILGLLKMGDLFKYIPHTLIVGFTTGIAVIIFSIQIKDFLGLTAVEMHRETLPAWSQWLAAIPSEFVHKWVGYFQNLDKINLWAIGIGLFTIAVTYTLQKMNSKVPGSLVAIIVTTLFVFFLKIPVETIFSRFGNLSSNIFVIEPIKISLNTVVGLINPAITIALLGALESILCCIVSDGMVGSKHRSNIELIAQGGGNILASLFGGLPATGAIARTVANIKNGGRSPIAGMVHALTLLAIIFVAMPLVKYIPLPTLSGILIVIAWNMSEMRAFRDVFKTNIHEAIVLLTTFLLTVFVDLTVGVISGFVLALLLFMRRMSLSTSVQPMGFVQKEDETLFNEELGEIPENVLIYEINGPLFFGSAIEFMNIILKMDKHYDFLILRMRYVPVIDASGIKVLKNINNTVKSARTQLLISGLNDPLREKLKKLHVLDDEWMFSGIKETIEFVRSHKKQNAKS